MKVTEKHVLFWGSVFSNWATARFVVDGNEFRTSEQYFMYMKAKTFKDEEIAQEILKYGTNPKEAKKLGRKVKNYDDAVWNVKRYDIMYDAIKYKFDANPQMKEELMSYHGKSFVEASPYDKVWGIGICEDDAEADDESMWKGTNLLGKALTELRDHYEFTNIVNSIDGDFRQGWCTDI